MPTRPASKAASSRNQHEAGGGPSQAHRSLSQKKTAMPLFLNFYQCYRCRHQWADVWSATCDDDYPDCGARHISPTRSVHAGDDEEANESAPAPTAITCG